METSDVCDPDADIRILRTSRRALLARAGAAAGAVTIGTAFVPLTALLPAAAQTEEEDLTDEDIAAFIESVELAAAQAYSDAVGTGLLSAAAAATANAFAAHHREHAAAFAALAGSKALGKANARLAEIARDQLRNARDEKAAVQVAYDIENGAAATHLFALGVLKSASAVSRAAATLPAESQHAAVLGQLLGKTAEEYVPSFENQDRAIDPAKFPTSPTTTTTTTTTK